MSTQRAGGTGGRRLRLVFLPMVLLLVCPLMAFADDGSNWLDRFEAGSGPESWAGDLRPIRERDWSYARAAHLLERAGFGGTPEEIEALAATTPERAVAALVDYESIDPSAAPPSPIS